VDLSITNYLLFCVLFAGLGLSIFQLIYAVLEYRTTKEFDARARVNMQALYRLPRSLALPVARLLARKSSAKALKSKSAPRTGD
jgi:hypothetical protein